MLIVGVTAGVFIWKQCRRRKFEFAALSSHASHCGCGSNPNSIGPKQTVQFRARKGERPVVLIKNL